MAGSKKIFSEKEASELLFQAAQLQENTPNPNDPQYTPGLTLEQLKNMAEDLGVDPAFLEKAIANAQDYSQNPSQKKKGFFSGIYQEFEAVVDGELPPEHFDIVLSDLAGSKSTSTSTSSSLNPTIIGRTLTGRIHKKFSTANFELTSRRGRTRIKATSTPFWPFFITGHLAFLGAFLGLALTAKAGQLNWALAFAILTAAGLTPTLIGTYFAKKLHGPIKQAFNQIVAKVDAENQHLRENLANSTPETQPETQSEDQHLQNRITE